MIIQIDEKQIFIREHQVCYQILLFFKIINISFVLALYNDFTRGKDPFLSCPNCLFHSIIDTVLARFDKYIGPILINVFSKITDLDVMKDWNANLTLPRRFSTRNQSVCSRLFAVNQSFNQASLKHSYANLYK